MKARRQSNTSPKTGEGPQNFIREDVERIYEEPQKIDIGTIIKKSRDPQ